MDSLPLPPRLIEAIKARGVRSLYPPQEEAVRAGLLEGENLLLCTATASGKSLLAEVVAVKTGMEGRMALYAVPLKALAHEKLLHLSHYGDLVRVAVSTGDYGSEDRWLHRYDVVVVTYEKLDSLLRHRPPWLASVGAIIIDEVHYVGDPKRGPVLESIVAKARALGLRAQLLGLSATVGNAEEVARWLSAKLVKSSWRPVPLREGVYHGGVIRFADGVRRAVRGGRDPEVALALDAMEGGGQALVFVNSRASTVRTARKIAEAVAAHVQPLVDVKAAGELAGEVERAASSKIIGRELAEVVARGVAFHNAGLELELRRLVEEGFRRGVIRAVVSTTTLAAGVNLPARRVVIADLRRYDPLFGMEEIPVMEYRQMAGRAGRPGLDPYGEAVAVASTAKEADYIMERYVRGEVEPVRSHMFTEVSMRAHALGAVGGGYASTMDELEDFFSATLAYLQSRARLALPSRLRAVVASLREWGFLEEAGGRLVPTELGREVARLYLDPEVAAAYIAMLKSMRGGGALAYLYLVSKAPDVPRARKGRPSEEAVEEVLAAFPGEDEDEEFEGRVLTAQMLAEWIDEVDEDKIYERYDVAPGDLRVYIDLFEWLGGAAARLAARIGLGDRARDLETVTARVVHGVREELLPLVQALRGVGRVRARVLYDHGYRTLADVAAASPAAIAALPGFGPRLAEAVVEQARALLR